MGNQQRSYGVFYLSAFILDTTKTDVRGPNPAVKFIDHTVVGIGLFQYELILKI